MSILDARESRRAHINTLEEEHPNKTVVILKTNVVGANKNLPYMAFICRHYSKIIASTFQDKILLMGHQLSLDGDYCYFVIDENGLLVKRKMIEIEESNTLGRLIDIDVYNNKSYSRTDLSEARRKCLLCENEAVICARTKAHSEAEIKQEMKSIVQRYLYDYILNITMRSIYNELELYPKFGLVSHIDSGCHTDMDYETFLKSAFAIKKYMGDYINAGFEESMDISHLIKTGLKAEKRMFDVTQNVNTYKGLIFLLGLFLPSITQTIILDEDTEYLVNQIKHIASTVIGDYYVSLSSKKKHSHSDKIYLEHGIKGIREEALNGLKIIFSLPSLDLNDDASYYNYLFLLMRDLNDTTIIHKTNIATLKEVQQEMAEFMAKGGYEKNKEYINQLSESYKERNISPGGSADMLIIKLIYENLKSLIRKGEA